VPVEVGQIEALFRYPVKSMRGESLSEAALGWHGLEGDRRLAFRKLEDRGGFPWLTAGKLPELVLFAPQRRDTSELPTHVRTPEGADLAIFGDDLARDVGRRFGAPVQMMQMNHGIFDDAAISIISSETIREIGRLSGRPADVRRFRPNIVVRSLRAVPFEEDEWVGGVLSLGDAAVSVTLPDLRCAMINLDPDTASSAPEVLKSVARANDTNAGIYCTVTRTGRLAVGQTIFLQR
jgi:uncharacterized protein